MRDEDKVLADSNVVYKSSYVQIAFSLIKKISDWNNPESIDAKMTISGYKLLQS